jgi:dTDP-4-dehydrorhamnose reductase
MPTQVHPRILVIGQTGQLAQALTQVDFGARAKVHFAPRSELDLAQPDTIGPVIEKAAPHLIINAAAYTAVDRAQSEVDLAFAINRDAVGAMAQAAAHIDAAMIHVSTDYVFDGSRTAAYAEDDAEAPQSVYGQSKLEGERALRGQLLRHVILRTSWVFSSTGSNFVKTMLRLGAQRAEIGVVADQRGRPTYAPDLAQWIGVIGKRLIARDGALGIFHAANAEPASWADFAEAIFDGAARRGARVPETLRRITTADYPTPAARPANSVLSTSRLETEYNLTLRSWRPALADCLDQLIGPDPHSGKDELQ